MELGTAQPQLVNIVFVVVLIVNVVAIALLVVTGHVIFSCCQ